MSRPMPTDNLFLSGNGAPLLIEGDARDLPVHGAVPEELAGTYYRNGSNPQFAPRGGYHLFDGDGMIHALTIRDGRVDYKNRWVRTERFLLEREAGESLFGSMVDPSAADPSVSGKSSNAANTNIVWHAGKLLALWEAGLPTELDPSSLETRGSWDFDGKLTRRIEPEIARQLGLEAVEGEGPGIMTAHPRVDPKTGEMHFFGYSATPPFLVYNVVSTEGVMLRSEEIDAPYPSMMHDFILTDEHVIFPVFPAAFDFDAMAQGTGILGWRPEKGTRVGVMPRGGSSADVQWIESDPCYVFHFANARDTSNGIVSEMCRFPSLPFFGEGGVQPPSLWRWSIDLAAGVVKEEQIDTTPAEFPRVDERFLGTDYRHVYVPCMVPEEGAGIGFNGLAHYDVASGEKLVHCTRAGSVFGEPVFVPRHPDSPEGEGFVLVIVYRDDEKRSDLLILDAENVEAEPLATVELPVRVPAGFHGNWRADD